MITCPHNFKICYLSLITRFFLGKKIRIYAQECECKQLCDYPKGILKILSQSNWNLNKKKLRLLILVVVIITFFSVVNNRFLVLRCGFQYFQFYLNFSCVLCQMKNKHRFRELQSIPSEKFEIWTPRLIFAFGHGRVRPHTE